MACHFPISAWESIAPKSNGKKHIAFKPTIGYLAISLPCGQCIGCRLARSRDWAVRCVHESSFYEYNCFLTLTYDDEHLPLDGSLRKSDLQKFYKRLRWHLDNKPLEFLSDAEHPIKYFSCGEYGDRTDRPHYHACMFNIDFPDKRLLYANEDGFNLYESDTLAKIWGKGMCSLGALTFDSACYVARYVTKKITGDMADDAYKRVDAYTGEIFEVLPEFQLQSTRPAIGRVFLDNYSSDIKKGYITLNGIKHPLPRYYKKYYEINSPNDFEVLKQVNKEAAYKKDANEVLLRLKDEDKIVTKKLNTLSRKL